MTILAGEIVTAGRLDRLQSRTYNQPATGNLTFTTTVTDIPGAVINLTTETDGATWEVDGTFDISVGTASASVLCEGRLYVDGAMQTGSALKMATVVDRATVYQQWSGTLATAGAHTFTLRGLRSSGSLNMVVFATHTKLRVEITEVV